jgi:phage-related tail fiber protein
MHKIDGPGHVSGQFVNEDPETARPPTVVTPEWLNAVQGELIAVIEAAGIAPSKANSAQVLAALKMIFGDGPGAVSFFARSTAPTGYMKANGAVISRSAYAALFASIGTTFGAGDGATTFNLPDLRGEFLRGWDDGRGLDSGRTFGSPQKGSILVYDTDNNGLWGVSSVSQVSTTSQAEIGVDAFSNADFPNAKLMGSAASVGPVAIPGTAGVESYAGVTRPRNVALLACIKY